MAKEISRRELLGKAGIALTAGTMITGDAVKEVLAARKETPTTKGLVATYIPMDSFAELQFLGCHQALLHPFGNKFFICVYADNQGRIITTKEEITEVYE